MPLVFLCSWRGQHIVTALSVLPSVCAKSQQLRFMYSLSIFTLGYMYLYTVKSRRISKFNFLTRGFYQSIKVFDQPVTNQRQEFDAVGIIGINFIFVDFIDV